MSSDNNDGNDGSGKPPDTTPPAYSAHYGHPPHNQAVPQDEARTTNSSAVLRAVQDVEQREKRIFTGIVVNAGLVLASCIALGSFAAWLLAGSKSYAQAVEAHTEQRVQSIEHRVAALDAGFTQGLAQMRTEFHGQNQMTQQKIVQVDAKLDEVLLLLARMSKDGGKK